MVTIAKGAIEGAWLLIVGWILPSGISLLLFRALVFPSLGGEAIVKAVSGSLGEEEVLLLLAAVLLGWFLSVLSTPLYRILEGYDLWPGRVRDSRVKHHRQARRDLAKKAKDAVGSIECARADHDLYSRYPLSGEQVLPTRLGNAIRSFECYGQDRYKLDTVRLWPHLMSCAPEALAREVNQARAGVDFFICLLYTQVMVSVAAMITLAAQRSEWRPLVSAAVIGLVVAVMSYEAAIAVTKTWAAAVRAIVDLGRLPLATAYGLCIPDSLDDERRMWEYLSWSLGYPYSPESAKLMDEFRIRRTGADAHDRLQADLS